MDCKCLICGYKWKTRKNKKYSDYPYNCANKDCNLRCWDFGTNINCMICQRKIMIPTIHHIDGNHKNNCKKNRLVLCSDCHTAIHKGIGFSEYKKSEGKGKRSGGRKGKRRTYQKSNRFIFKELKRLREFYLNKILQERLKND